MSDVRGRVGKYRGFWMSFVALLFASMCVCSPALAQDVDMSDDDFIDDDSTTSITITDNSQDNDQLCAPIVNQYNNVTQGGGQALAGGDAVASVANKAEVSNNVVINCLNGDGNSVGGAAASAATSAGTQYNQSASRVATPKNEAEDDKDAGVASAASASTAPENLCSAGTTLDSMTFDQDDEDGVTFTADDNGFVVTLTDASGDLDGGEVGNAGLPVNYDESSDDDKDGDLELTNNISQTVDESGTFTLTADDDEIEDAAYTVRASYCVEDDEDENSTQSRQSSVMDGTYDKSATLANTGGQTDGVMSASTVSSVAIPAGALCLVVSAGLAVGMRSRYRG